MAATESISLLEQVSGWFSAGFEQRETASFIPDPERGESADSWRDWWCSKDAQVYQFIGEDNVYFYGPAEMAMFLGMQGTEYNAEPPEGAIQVPELVVNKHLLFLDRKASSSGKIRIYEFFVIEQYFV